MTDWRAAEDAVVLPTYEKFPFALARGEGHWVWDEEGTRYLDLYGGHAVCLLGHCPKPVVDAVSKQAGELLFYSNLVYLRGRARAAKALTALCARPDAQVFFCNSGTEANEAAMKLARLATGRREIVATTGSFHGRTAGSASATGLPKYRKSTAGMGADVVHVPFGDLAAAGKALGPEAAGFLLEPIQSMAGVVMPPDGYLEGLEKLCRERGALLLFDEVQTGLGRLGAPSAAQAYGVTPHAQTFAKAIGSGLPSAAVLVDPAVAAKIKSGDLGTTFGGGPIACAAIAATLETIMENKLWERAATAESLLRSALRLPGVSIRGKGLLLALVLDRPSRAVRAHLLARRILVGGADDPNVIRLLPPLTIGPEEVGMLKDALKEALSR